MNYKINLTKDTFIFLHKLMDAGDASCFIDSYYDTYLLLCNQLYEQTSNEEKTLLETTSLEY